MSVFTVESLPASFGDALWIEYGEEGEESTACLWTAAWPERSRT